MSTDEGIQHTVRYGAVNPARFEKLGVVWEDLGPLDYRCSSIRPNSQSLHFVALRCLEPASLANSIVE